MEPLVVLLTIPVSFALGVALGYKLRPGLGWLQALLAVVVAILLPIALVWSANAGTPRPCDRDPCDAAPMVFIGSIIFFPIFWLFGIVITAFGVFIGRYASPANRADREPVKLGLE